MEYVSDFYVTILEENKALREEHKVLLKENDELKEKVMELEELLREAERREVVKEAMQDDGR